MSNEQSVQDLIKSLQTGHTRRFWIGGIATWRLTEILLDEDAPFEMAKKLRLWAATNGDKALIMELHKALSCPWCLSVWLGWFVAILQKDKGWFITGFAYSAIAIFLVMFRKGLNQWLVQSAKRS